MSVARTLRPELSEEYRISGPTKRAGSRDAEGRLECYGILPRLNRDMHVFDIGCNSGLISLALAPRVGTVTGIDIYPPFIEEADRLRLASGVTNCSFLAEPFSVGNFNNSKFDLILSLAAHFWMEDLARYVTEMTSLLAPGGLVLIESHNLSEPHHREDWEVVLGALHPLTILDHGATEEELSYAGFDGTYSREFILATN